MPKGFKDSNFRNIKETIIKYAKSDPTIKDYDYAGSTANSMVSMQAYTLLKNQLLSNITLLESNIFTARDRRSVVMHAQGNGYTPSGVMSSKLTIAMRCTNRNQDPSIKIPRGTRFQGQQREDGKSYRFVTKKDVNAIRGEGGLYFPIVDLAQGRIMRIETTFDSSVPIIIRDKLIDRNEMRVWVNDELWANWTYNNIVNASGGSTVYYVRETFDEETEIRFGVGEVSYSKAGGYRENNYIGGLKPIEGSKIVIEYLRTDGFVANGCKFFTYNDTIRDLVVDSLLINYNNDPNFIGSYGGGDVEDIESVRENGILSLETQNRAVTDVDWMTILDRKYSPIIQARQIFNPPGAQNIVAVSIKPKGALNLTTDQARDIKEYLSEYHMGKLHVEIQTPLYVFIKHNIKVSYSANELMESKDWLERRVIENITKFYKEEVEFFNTPLHKSKLLTAIDASHPSIKGSSASFDLVREVEGFYQTTHLGISFYNKTKQGSFKSGNFTFIRNPDRDPTTLELANEVFIQSAKRTGDKSVVVAGPFIKGDIKSTYKPYTGTDIQRPKMQTIDKIQQTEYYEIGVVNHKEDIYEWSFGSIGLVTDNFIDPFIEIFVQPTNDDIVSVGLGGLLIYEHDLRPQYTKFSWNLSK